MKVRSTVYYLLFALLLLFSQQLVVTHAISHLGSPSQTAPDHPLPADGQCDECLASAALGAALGSSFQANFATHLAHSGLRADFAELILPAAYPPFNTRAPPSLTKTI